MSVVGIIAEYNPLHAGHAWHIAESKRVCGAEACVCVLSSNFVQRGEPAVISKTARTQMALASGVDLVIELPAAFSCSSAEYFATAGVKLLDSLGVVDAISFGSETGELEPLLAVASVLVEESDAFKELLKKSLDSGLSFPASREKALNHMLGNNYGQIVSSPNNILSIEYLKALERLSSPIGPVTIPRKGQGYHEKDLGLAFSSATAIRNHIMACYPFHTQNQPDSPLYREKADHCFKDLSENMPDSSLEIFKRECVSGRAPVFMEAFETTLLHLLRSSSHETLEALPYMEPGLAQRLKRVALQQTGLSALVSASTSSRYPSSRIRRILCALLLGMTGDFLEALKQTGYAQYVRVLGFNDAGKTLLARMKKKCTLPIITKPSSYKQLENSLAVKLFEYEIRASDIYALGCLNKDLRTGGNELVTPVINQSGR